MVFLLCLTNNPYLSDGCQFLVSLSGSCLSSLKPVIIFPSINCKFKCTCNVSVVCNYCCLERLRVIHL